MSNLQYRSPSMDQEFSHRTLTNMGYFWDEKHRVYYFHVSKNGRKIYNFDDPAEFGDEVIETHVADDQPIGDSHDVPQGDAFMQDADHEDGQGNKFSAGYRGGSSEEISYHSRAHDNSRRKL